MFLDKKSGGRTSSSDLFTKQLSKAQFVRKMQEVRQVDTVLPSKEAREGEKDREVQVRGRGMES